MDDVLNLTPFPFSPCLPLITKLSHDIFKIENTEMARVLTIIESDSPNALSRKSTGDEVLINLDALTPSCFHEVRAPSIYTCMYLYMHICICTCICTPTTHLLHSYL